MIVHEKTDFSFIYCFHASVPHIDLYCCPNSRADYYVKGLCKHQTKHWQCSKWYCWLFLKWTKKQNNLLVSVSVCSCVLVSKFIFAFTFWKQWRKDGSFPHSAKIFIEILIHHNGCADTLDPFRSDIQTPLLRL